MVASEEITSALFGYGSFDLTSVKNSSKALFYFALGLPAFSLIKIYSSFLFARHNTKIPFYYSLISVILNIFISVLFFNKIGFIIIPISTTISSWFNSLLLYSYLKKNNYYLFNQKLLIPLLKILVNSSLIAMLFYFLINVFQTFLSFDSEFKFITIILLVICTIISYLFISLFTKTFKFSDIKLKY